MKRGILLCVLVNFLTPSESATPYKATGLSNINVQNFNIEGCDEKWCRLKEQTPYTLFVNWTESIDVRNLSLSYQILDGYGIESFGSFDLKIQASQPSICKKRDCFAPHMELRQISFAKDVLNLRAPLRLWDFLQGTKKVILRFHLYRKLSPKYTKKLFYVDVTVSLLRCWPLCL